jgi:hypothetical protein
MQTTYFLFGQEASAQMMDEGFESLIESLEDEMDIDFDLFEVTPETNPAEFLHTFQAWGDYCVLSGEEYGRLGEFL